MRNLSKVPLVAALLLAPAAVTANETVHYSYDAKGRLTTVAHSGTVNDGLVTQYSFDSADNRTSVVTSGASGRVIVVPLNGLSLIHLSS